MPFKSEKQRKWMHANKPEMAKKWEKKEKKMKRVKELIKKINDLGDDFDNMSSGGKRCYNEIQKQLYVLIPKLADAITLYEDA